MPALRAATNKDCSAAQQLIFDILREYGLRPDPTGTDADLSDLEGFYLKTGGAFDVATDESGRIIGTVGLLPMNDGACELRKMYLHRSARGKGLGKAMLRHAVKRARELGFRRIELETASVLKEAVALYKAHGFQPSDRTIHAGRCDQVLVLDLNDENPALTEP